MDFFHTLPRPGIKKHLTPILAGLLEVNPQKMWTFEKFFNEVRQTPFLALLRSHMDIGTSGDQLAGEEESLCVLHEQVEPAACLPRQIPSKLLILNLYPPYK